MELGETVYVTLKIPELSYDAGRDQAQTWADLIAIDLEHLAYDIIGLTQFMRGLKDGGPTASGHLTPTVLVSPPANCTSVEEVIYNAWQVRQILSTGVHGIYYPQARDAESVRAYVTTTRYTFQMIGRDLGLSEGLRGHGGENQASEIWGISPAEYLIKADPWPLNPEGELLLGLKIEDRQGIANADAIASTPGLAFVAVGVADLSMSLGYQSFPGWPYPPDLLNGRLAAKSACEKAGIAYFTGWPDSSLPHDEQLKHLFEEGSDKMLLAQNREFADAGRSWSKGQKVKMSKRKIGL